jgi:hypothetical protein
MTVVAVTRAGIARLDFADLVGQDGDILHVMVTDKALDRMNSRLAMSVGEAAGHGSDGRRDRPDAVPADPPDANGIDGIGDPAAADGAVPGARG